jgi:hypothetical protein
MSDPFKNQQIQEQERLQAADGAQGECPKGLASRRIRPCVPLKNAENNPDNQKNE